jgi:hypothetical protein
MIDTTTKLLLFIGAILSLAIGIPSVAAIRLARKQKRRLADYAVEVATHWPDMAKPFAAVSTKRSTTYHAASRRSYDLAMLRKAGFADSEIRCTHRHDASPRSIPICEERVDLDDDIPACADCISALLVNNGTVCASCDYRILPGDDVAAIKPGAYAHLRTGCCDDLSRYCGVWGQGKLLSLHDMYPTAFPGGSGHTLDRQIFARRRLSGDNSN